MYLVNVLIWLTFFTIPTGLMFWALRTLVSNIYLKELLFKVERFFLLATLALEMFMLFCVILAFLTGNS